MNIIIIITDIIIIIIMQQAQCLAIDTLKLQSIKKCRLPLSSKTVSVSPWATAELENNYPPKKTKQNWT